jgi:WD40 repeat protein
MRQVTSKLPFRPKLQSAHFVAAVILGCFSSIGCSCAYNSLVEPCFTVRADAFGYVKLFFLDDCVTLCVGTREKATFWNTTTGTRNLQIKEKRCDFGPVACSQDGSSIGFGCGELLVLVRKNRDLQTRVELSGHTKIIHCLAFSQMGQVIVSGAEDGTVRVWDAMTGEARAVLHGHTQSVKCIAVSPNGEFAASAAEDGTVRVWDLSKRVESAKWQVYAACLAFSPDGNLLATGSNERVVRVHSLETGRELVKRRCADEVNALAFTRDGKLLAAGCGQAELLGQTSGKVVFWEVSSWKKVAIFDVHSQWVIDISFCPDGTRLATCDNGGEVTVWRVPSR